MHDRRDIDLDDDSRLAHWTRGEKRRAMKAAEAHEQSVSFWARIRRISVTITAVFGFWLMLKQIVGEGWSTFMAFLGGSSPK